MKDILSVITAYREERGWTEYQLAERSGLLFAEEDDPVALTDSQKKLLESWARLTEEQQAVVFALIEKM